MARVAFIHPDLGIGGAERLVVDAALALKSKRHSVEIFTAHHDPNHCFEQTRDGSLNVHVAGDWLPRHCFQKGYALFAYIRMVYVAIYLVFFSKMRFDVIFCDLVSVCTPILKLSRAKVIFYCHFPDQLLTQRKTKLKKIYRWPLDTLEEKTTGMADTVLVNSRFTSQVFHSTFKSLGHVRPLVVHPSLNFSSFDRELPSSDYPYFLLPQGVTTIFLSINRYERKKNLPLAIKAFSILLGNIETEAKSKVHLIMAGGYDERVLENKEHHLELKELATSLEVDDKVTFIRSFKDTEKVHLLNSCTALIYTPSNEHFGICPLEAMYMGRPAIAVNSGGPLESVLDGETGFLCEPTPQEFANAMLRFVHDSKLKTALGDVAKDHVQKNFSFDAFSTKLDDIVEHLCI